MSLTAREARHGDAPPRAQHPRATGGVRSRVRAQGWARRSPPAWRSAIRQRAKTATDACSQSRPPSCVWGEVPGVAARLPGSCRLAVPRQSYESTQCKPRRPCGSAGLPREVSPAIRRKASSTTRRTCALESRRAARSATRLFRAGGPISARASAAAARTAVDESFSARARAATDSLVDVASAPSAAAAARRTSGAASESARISGSTITVSRAMLGNASTACSRTVASRSRNSRTRSGNAVDEPCPILPKASAAAARTWGSSSERASARTGTDACPADGARRPRMTADCQRTVA